MVDGSEARHGLTVPSPPPGPLTDREGTIHFLPPTVYQINIRAIKDDTHDYLDTAHPFLNWAEDQSRIITSATVPPLHRPAASRHSRKSFLLSYHAATNQHSETNPAWTSTHCKLPSGWRKATVQPAVGSQLSARGKSNDNYPRFVARTGRKRTREALRKPLSRAASNRIKSSQHPSL